MNNIVIMVTGNLIPSFLFFTFTSLPMFSKFLRSLITLFLLFDQRFPHIFKETGGSTLGHIARRLDYGVKTESQGRQGMEGIIFGIFLKQSRPVISTRFLPAILPARIIALGMTELNGYRQQKDEQEDKFIHKQNLPVPPSKCNQFILKYLQN
ncbi:hypothetical protein [Desulfobulbus alkaliphilus]|uniref:hypothetical protein n=1 Tax=Desulfobulbus alkaliphilus TaxID=869814 RepID=UPI001962314E|nr:hypothetical protein [Desulfobulbus alkaliphilus]MBM9537123.1 hypothetical protein [Desulfobulbus alkaliphilus]